jgi:hypothetical protein
MQRIKALWLSNDFPSPDQFADLGKEAAGIYGTMQGIVEKADLLPTADDLRR